MDYQEFVRSVFGFGLLFVGFELAKFVNSRYPEIFIKEHYLWVYAFAWGTFCSLFMTFTGRPYTIASPFVNALYATATILIIRYVKNNFMF